MNTARDLTEREIKIERERLLRIERKVLAASFKLFAQQAWKVVEPGRKLKWNWHLDVICDHLEKVRTREIKRLLINVPPRTTKSTLVNVFFPVWVWAINPSHQFNNYSHNQSLATRDSLASRRLIESDWFRERWGNVFKITGDQNQKNFFQNDKGGHRRAFGLGGGITGVGADTQIIDDPHDAQSAQSTAERQNVLDVLDNTLPSRFNDFSDGAMILIMQRLHEDDAAGHALAKASGKHWTHLCFPMEYDPGHPHVCDLDPRTEAGELLWPSRFPQDVVSALKDDQTPYAFSGQYQQRPTPDGGGILPRSEWREWGKKQRLKGLKEELPVCDYIVQCWDTAYEDQEENDYSACTTWGVFKHEEEDRWAVILLDRFRERLAFPKLRERAREIYDKHNPDVVLIEPKATGKSLIQELRRKGVPVQEWEPERSRSTGREVDKTARTHAASVVLYDGCVWYVKRNWVLEVIEECATFPKGKHDDLTDTCTMAWLWLRRGWRIELKDDNDDDDDQEEKEPDIPSAYGE